MTTCEFNPRRRTPSASLLALASVAVAATWMTATIARAQSEDQASARALFDEGRRLLKARKYDDACPKLEAARKLYTSAGILLNLADCYEKIGRTASAWTEFGEAATVAARTSRAEDAQEARRRQAGLEPRLARIVIRVERPVAELTVKRDGATLVAAAWGAALPVDPGAHTILAEAPGHEPWSVSVTVSRAGQIETVAIPELRATMAPLAAASENKIEAPVAASAPPPAAAPVPSLVVGSTPETTVVAAPRSGKTLPWVVVAAGAVVGVGGGVLMLVESSRAQTARDSHDPTAYDATRTPWTVGLIAAIAGGVGLAVGGALVALAPGDSRSSRLALSGWVGGDTGGFVLSKRW